MTGKFVDARRDAERPDPKLKLDYQSPSLIRYGPLFLRTTMMMSNDCSPGFLTDNPNDPCDPDGGFDGGGNEED